MYIRTAMKIADHIKKFIPKLYLSGSYRRKENYINDLDIITKRDLNKVWEEFKWMYGDNIEILKNGDKYMQMRMSFPTTQFNIDIWKANDNYEYRFHKWLFNLSKGHQIYYKKQAQKKGYTLSPNGLYNNENESYIDVQTLKDLKRILDI